MSILGSQLSVTSTPLVEGGARGLGTLDTDQSSVVIGEPIHIVFGKRLTDSGGILVSPPASEARFESYTDSGTDYIKAYYQLVLSDGEIGRIQVRDVFQQSCRVGTSYTTYNTRAGQWEAGNTLASSVDVPQFCGTGGSYEGLTMMSFENAIPEGFEQWKRQVHVFVRNGVKVSRLIEEDTDSSNNFADLVYYLLQRTARLPVSQIDVAGLTSAARFLNANALWCDTLLQQSGNLVDWLQQTAPLFLLRRARSNGKESLKPLIPTNADGTINTGFVSWTYTFTNEHILPDGFEVRYTALNERKPFAALMMWRQQPDDDIGLVRTTEVRYFGTATSGPYEQHDLTQFATTENHAVKVGTYILARRRYIEHTLRLVVAPAAYIGSISVGDIVRVNSSNTDQSGETLNHDYLYEVDSISKTLTGNVELQLTHFPIDDQGRSLVALDVSRAQGTNYLLPTGREAVSCDSNDPLDTSLLPDWPTIDWDTDFGSSFDVPVGCGIWTYDPTNRVWENPHCDLVTDLDIIFPDGIDLAIALPNITLLNLNQGVAPNIGLSELTVSYPQTTYYDVYASNYALVKGKVSVDRPPFSNLEANLVSSLGNARIVIQRADADATGPYETEFVLAASLDQPFYCRSGAVEVGNVDGGGFTEYTLPDGQGFTVCPYVGTASLSSISFTSTQCEFTIGIDKPCLTDPAVIKIAVGDAYWDWDPDTVSWRWTTDEYLKQPEPKVIEVELEAYYALIDDYLYNAISGQWEYIGTGTPGSAPSLPQPPTPVTRTVTYDQVAEALQPNLRVWILEARQGGFSSIYYDPAKQVASPPSGPQPFLLVHFDGTNGATTYTDSSTNAFTVQNATYTDPADNTASLSTAVSKFGNGSLQNDFYHGVVEVVGANWSIEAGADFAIDFWIKHNEDTAIGPDDVVPIYFDFQQENGDQIQFFLYFGAPNIWNNTTYEDYIWMSEAVISDRNWHHVAIERYQGFYRTFLDGVVSNDSFEENSAVSASTFYIGDQSLIPDGNVGSIVYQYLDEFRIINYAPYQGASFTPPTAPYDDP